MDTERLEGQDESVQAERMAEGAHLPEALGPFVYGQSRFDASVFASPDDEPRIRDAFAIFFANKDWETADNNSRRDAMHVATAARYGGQAFVTAEKQLFVRNQQIKAALGIYIWSPTQAVNEVLNAIRALRRLHELEPRRGPLPDWPN
ncbi:hypothetical protein [Streptomyces sp. NPDC058084]|uniref:hypothetical protein n=1 Tax=Streptomyces sp. NPDC058084 TaxID=3346333 RepID=UPI0036E5C276